jgi:hypothetical protein
MKWPSFILGYHGCDREVGEAILAGELALRPSTNLYDWLGTGIYFWENNPARALEWARLAAKHGKRTAKAVREPFVIGAVVDPGNCLDLLETDSIRLVEQAHREMSEEMRAEKRPLPVNRKVGGEYPLRYLDCAVINFLHQDMEEAGLPSFDSVRAAFVEGTPIYQGAGFHRHTHTQICVRSASSVLGCFRVRMS